MQGKKRQTQILAGISVSIFLILACRPIFTIGWEEFLFLIFVIGLLVGPPLYRFFRRLENSRRKKDR